MRTKKPIELDLFEGVQYRLEIMNIEDAAVAKGASTDTAIRNGQ